MNNNIITSLTSPMFISICHIGVNNRHTCKYVSTLLIDFNDLIFYNFSTLNYILMHDYTEYVIFFPLIKVMTTLDSAFHSIAPATFFIINLPGRSAEETGV